MNELWQYLRERICSFGEETLFEREGLTYRRLLEELDASAEVAPGTLMEAGGIGRRDQALRILRIVASGGAAVPVDGCYGEEFARAVRGRIEGEACPRDLAFLLFTSGTTGAPKGVMLSRRNIVSNLEGIGSYFELAPGDRLLIARPLVHAAVLTGELLFGLSRGAKLDFFEEPFNPRRLAAYIDLTEPDAFCCTPTMMWHLSSHLVGKSLKRVSLSGERLKPVVVARLRERYPWIRFYNGYGLTENGPRVSALLPQDFFERPGSVGRALPDTELKLVDGELWVKSPSVMQGYFRDEARTAERLADGWLRTGDSAAFRDGFLYILGRTDDMIIRAGVNVFPAEVENVAAECPGVRDCLCYGEDDVDYGQKICLKASGACVRRELVRFLAARLPAHLMPAKVEMTDCLPKTASGKIVRGGGRA